MEDAMVQRKIGYHLFPSGVLLLVLITVFAACGPNTTTMTTTQGKSTKPTGPGTPVSGASQTPVVTPRESNESLFIANGTTYVSSNDGNLYALRSQNGTERWRHNFNGPVNVVYAIVNNVIYMISFAQHFNTIYALNADNGAVIWQRQVGLYVSGLTVYNNALYFNSNAYDNVDASLYALNARDGSILWQQTQHVDMPVPLTILDGILYLRENNMQTGHETLYALRPSDGKPLWSYYTGDGSGGPVVANGVAYFTTAASDALAIQESNGKVLWKFTRDTNENSMGAAPTIENGIVYINAHSTLYALRANDGSLIWQRVKDQAQMQGTGEPVVGNGAVYVVEGEGIIYAYKTSDGTLLWQQHINNSIFGPLIYENGHLQVQTQSNMVYALQASDGHLLWQQQIGAFNNGSEETPYLIDNGTVAAGTDDGIVRVFRANDGKLLWQYAIPPKAFLPDPVYGAAITFTSSASYQQALQSITDLGLQPVQPCINPSAPWKPANYQERFPYLLVISTPLAPLGWVVQLQHGAGIKDVQENPVFHCPLNGEFDTCSRC